MNSSRPGRKMPQQAAFDIRKYFVWALLALPAGLLPSTGMPIEELLHPTGEFSARLLVIVLCVTPLLKITGRARWTLWLLRYRRAFGVAAFGYALLHTVLYAIDRGAIQAMLAELPEAGIWLGWVAGLVMLVPAVISNDWSVRTLRASWKPLQRLSYVCGIATVLHWGFVHGGWTAALVHAAPVLLIHVAAVLHRKISRKRKAEAALRDALAKPLAERADCKGTAPGAIIPIVDPAKCEGVDACVQVCPYDVFEIGQIPEDIYAALPVGAKLKQKVHGMQIAFTPRADQCMNCGLCVAVCPEDAIKLRRA